VTVLLAGAAFGVLKHLQADRASEVSGSHLKGGMKQGKEFVVGRGQDGEGFLSRQGLIFKRFSG
jgi:hypothetical protein